MEGLAKGKERNKETKPYFEGICVKYLCGELEFNMNLIVRCKQSIVMPIGVFRMLIHNIDLLLKILLASLF